MTSSKMDILPTINPGTGAASGAADTSQKGSRPGGDGSFADMLSSANAKAGPGKGKSAKSAHDKGSTGTTGRTGAESATEPGNTGKRGLGRTGARPTETTEGTIAGAKGADGTASVDGTGTTNDGSAGAAVAAGLAGAMLNSVVGTATGDKSTSPITDAVLGSGAVAGGPKPQPGAQTQTAAGAPPASTDPSGAAQTATAASTPTATGTPAPGTGTGTGAGATGPNLVMTPDGEPADAGTSATLLAAADSGKSTPGKANSLVTGSSDVVAAKTALRTSAIDPTTMAKDAKSPAGGGGTAASSDAATSSLANGGDANAAGNARTVNQAAAESAAARAQRSDPVKADPAAAPGAPATPTDVGAAQTTVAASTAAVTGADATSPAHHTAHAAAARAMPGPVPVFDQIALNVHRAAAEGLDRITIQLKPESLGRVDVHLQLGHDGRMTATFVADRQDTLDMLQRDARGLERALNDAGLRTDTGGLSFNLRGDGREFGNPAQNMGQGTHDGGADGGADADTTAEAARPERVINGLLDISV